MATAKGVSLTQRAYGLLSRREYGRKELARALADYAESYEALESLLDSLQKEGYQSDERYAEMFIRSRVSRGQGEVRIRNDLNQKGVDKTLIAEKLREAEVDWFECARQQRVKKVGFKALDDPKAKAKVQRFLLYRGFTHEQCQYAIESSEG